MTMDDPRPGRFGHEPSEPGIIDLVGRLASDGMRLLKEEGQLATLQLREVLLSSIWSLVRLTVPLGMAGIAAVLIVIGVVAWLAARMGSLWAGALVAGGVLLAVSLVLLWLAGRALGRQTRTSLAAPPEVPGARKEAAREGPRLMPGEGADAPPPASSGPASTARASRQPASQQPASQQPASQQPASQQPASTAPASTTAPE
jgi:hypothetical protein